MVYGIYHENLVLAYGRSHQYTYDKDVECPFRINIKARGAEKDLNISAVNPPIIRGHGPCPPNYSTNPSRAREGIHDRSIGLL